MDQLPQNFLEQLSTPSAKVPKVLGKDAPKFLGTSFYQGNGTAKLTRTIYNFPKREAMLMAMSYSYDLPGMSAGLDGICALVVQHCSKATSHMGRIKRLIGQGTENAIKIPLVETLVIDYHCI